jgi:hypothetical protein
MYAFRHQAYLTDEQLALLFWAVVNGGLYDSLYYNGGLKAPREWVEYVRDECWLFQGELQDGTVIAFAWMDGFTGGAARFHHCTLRAHWRHALPCALAALEWLESLPDLGRVQTLFGLTPANNALAVKFLSKAGWYIMGRMPNALALADGRVVDAIVSHYQLRRQPCASIPG